MTRHVSARKIPLFVGAQLDEATEFSVSSTVVQPLHDVLSNNDDLIPSCVVLTKKTARLKFVKKAENI